MLRFLRNLTSRTRSKRADFHLGVLLAFVAGAINAGGFLAIGYYTSHMTGIVSTIADALALHQWYIALLAAAFLLSFLCGAVVSCLIINTARGRRLSSEFAYALMLEALLLLAFGFSASGQAPEMPVTATICLLCFIMGLQNAIITKISRAEVRTTHITGIVTDIGIELGRYLYASRHPDARPLPDKLRLHASLLAAFLFGGVVGAVTFKSAGFIMAVPLAMALALVAWLPLWDDMRRQ